MARYRKKPLIIEAIQFTGHNIETIAEFLEWNWTDGDDYCSKVVIETLEGDMTAEVGDFIIKGIKGEAYPCRADIFAATYEPVDDLKPSVPRAPMPAPDTFPDPCTPTMNLLETDVTG